MPAETLHRTLHPEIKVISEQDGTVDYIASDESIDSYAEIIAARGWRFTRFQKNAPFVDSHNYWSIQDQLGKVTQFSVQSGKLVERVQWAKDIPENNLAMLGWKMTVGGFLKAVSVGFFAVRYVTPGGDGWGQAVTDLRLSPDDAGKCRLIYLEQEQIELSACIIGANPNALAKAHQQGAVKDADLAAVGMDDDDMSFIHLANDALEKGGLDALSAKLVEREMARISAKARSGKTPFKGPQSSSEDGSSSARTRVAAEAAERRAHERAEFLRKLSATA